MMEFYFFIFLKMVSGKKFIGKLFFVYVSKQTLLSYISSIQVTNAIIMGRFSESPNKLRSGVELLLVRLTTTLKSWILAC